jgi:hypothetical protein
MPGGFAPRFAIEAGFLILLGVGSGLANLRTAVIVAVLSGGWLLVSLIELSVWKAHARPIAPFVPPPQPEPEEAPDLEHGWPADDGSVSDTVEPDEVAYPLRADAGAAPSEEVEAYTRVLGGQPEDRPPNEPAE